MKMAKFHGLALVVSALALAGCNASPGMADAPAQSEAGMAVIPVTIVQDGKRHLFHAEVAATPAEQQRGLMYRRSIARDAAMLFPFAQPKFASFWQKNMLISIDMIYIRADGTIDRIVENTIPGNEEPAVSGGEVAAVLEVAAGTAERLGLDDTATVSWTWTPQ
ncbi:MAG: DUF192 domain-containing protein [Sphingomonadales bacterium]|nr:DUF192 domain-containing protein [Sphingomonadales bacterium]